MNKPRWSDGRELVLIDWLTRKENFDRYNSYLKSNKRNMQGPLLMEIEEEMKRNRKTRTLNQISQHLNKLLKRYRDTVDFLQEARLVGGVLPTMDELNQRFEYFERISILDPEEDAFVMHPKKQAKSPSLPFNIKSSSPIQHAVKHHHIAVVTTTSTTTSSTKSHSSSHSLSSPQLMHMNHNEVGAVHHHMNQYPFHQQHSTISSSRYSPVSSPNIFIKRLQSSAPASPSTSESSFSVSRLTSTSYRPATLINTSSPSTTLMTTSSTSEAGVPVYAASRKETSSDFDGDHYYQRHQHHSSSGSSSSIASHEASSSVHSRAPSVVEYQALHYAHPAYARRPPTYEVADLNSNVRATTSSTSGAAPSSSAISATSSATSTPYLCSPPLSTDPNSSGAREFAAVAGDVKGERKCSFESMLVDDQLYHHQGAVAARRCSSSPQLKPLISPDYLEILRLEAMKASAEAQAKKAKREEMLAKIDLVKSLTAAGCTKEEIIKAIGPFVSPDTGSEQVSEKRHDKTASIVNNNDTQLTMEE